MKQLWAIDESYREELRTLEELTYSVTERMELESAFDELEAPYYEQDGTAYLKIQGVLTKRWSFASWLLGGMPTPYLQEIFRKAADRSEVKRIMLCIDSPGGEVAGLSEFAQEIRECSKPVHAHISGHCTSGAYWLASQADEITASRTSLVGSIGAYISFLKSSREGVKEITYRSSKHKAPEPDSEEGKAEYQKLVEGIAELFEADVAVGRHISVEQVRADYGQGKVFLAQAAQEKGLIDEVINSSSPPLHNIQTSHKEIAGMEKEVKTEDAAAAVDQADLASIERERIKRILSLGGSKELTEEAIDAGMSVEAAAVMVNAELQEEIRRLKTLADRKEDAEVLETLKQEPAGEVKPEADEKNVFGVSFRDVDQELSSLESTAGQEG